jgi:homopolymeric O-antigen transport system permease protein
MRATNIVTTYEPDNCLKKGYLAMLREIASELNHNRWLTYQLFKRDFVALYKQSFVGILWAIIIPLITVGTFVALNRSGVFNIGDIGVPYAIYAVLGMAFWQLFSAGLIATSNSLVNAGTMVTQISFSRKSLIIASMGQALVSFIVQFSLVIVLFVYYSIVPNPAILLTPVFLVPLLLITLGLGFILSLVNGILRDIGTVLSIVMTFILLLTPILYAKPTSGFVAVAASYNPVYYLVSVPRSLILSGTTQDWGGYVVSILLSLVIFIVCLFAFHLTESRVAERV